MKYKDIFSSVFFDGQLYSLDDYVLNQNKEEKSESPFIGRQFKKTPDKYFSTEDLFGGLTWDNKNR